MKVILLLVLSIINLVYCDKVFPSFALWNDFNNGQATIGMINLPTAESKTLATIPGYQHFESNQYSTFNSHTNLISFLVNSNSSDAYYLYQYDINKHQLDQVEIDLNGIEKIYSIASSNNTNEEFDLFFIYESVNGDLVLGKLNESTNSITQENTLQGIFCSAAYDSTNFNYYILTNVNGIYTLQIFTRDGSSSTGIVPLKFQNQKEFNFTSDPYNMVYLESFDIFYFWIDIDLIPSLFTVVNSVIIESKPNNQYIFINKKAYAIASTNLINQNNQEFFQVVSIKHSNYVTGNGLINTFNSQSQFVNSYPTDVLPINMWIV